MLASARAVAEGGRCEAGRLMRGDCRLASCLLMVGAFLVGFFLMGTSAGLSGAVSELLLLLPLLERVSRAALTDDEGLALGAGRAASLSAPRTASFEASTACTKDVVVPDAAVTGRRSFALMRARASETGVALVGAAVATAGGLLGIRFCACSRKALMRSVGAGAEAADWVLEAAGAALAEAARVMPAATIEPARARALLAVCWP